ncbi:hypothetical protein P154DRAFT_529207 [Amniculicola lignicola CBS 123094]|uniref:Uncharacterized protein n=1 Tax=Amniculicola lignicola CBS 123094 TaxID=1392246 RepID=A0A6A5X400_9PLEO|nr:hypothetical protein P154DRAFT_529207 [Amniculicola lignicola CBS 123094]
MKLHTAIPFINFYPLITCIIARSTTSSPPLILTPLASSGGACLPNSAITTALTPVGQSENVALYELHQTIPVFTPWIESYIPGHDQRRNCKMNFTISVAEGWRMKVSDEGMDISGYLRMENSTKVILMASWYLISKNNTSLSADVEFDGPISGRFERHLSAGEFGKGQAVSGCGEQDVLQVSFWIRAFSGNQFPEGEVGVAPQPGDKEREWRVKSNLEVIRC